MIGMNPFGSCGDGLLKPSGRGVIGLKLSGSCVNGVGVVVGLLVVVMDGLLDLDVLNAVELPRVVVLFFCVDVVVGVVVGLLAVAVVGLVVLVVVLL